MNLRHHRHGGWRAVAWRLVLLTALAAPGARAAPPPVPPTPPLAVVDDRGVTVSLAQVPRRIISLLPSLTETVCALGACDRLVAVDDFSNWPAAVNALPRVGGLDDAQVETIVALRPDLVLAAASTRALARLHALGVPVVALEPRTLADFRRVAGQIDTLLATGQATRLLARIDADVAAAAASVPEGLRRTRVYFEVSPTPYAAGASSFIGQLMETLGFVNVVPAALGPFPQLNPEYVVRADPQVIMVSGRSTQALSARPGWRGIDAVRRGRLCPFTPAQGDVLVRPGPRMAEGARLMVDCVQGRLGRAS